jgi:hypothetical protein
MNAAKMFGASLMVSALLLGSACGLALSGCQAGTTGALRPIDSTVEHTITNAVTIVTNQVAPQLPVPVSTIAEAAGGAVLALLAAWQVLTHRAVKQLEAVNTEDKQQSKL